LIENPFDFGGLWNVGRARKRLFMVAFLGDNIIAQIDAFVADINGRTGDQLSNLVLTLTAE
jgi:hypothetical protein